MLTVEDLTGVGRLRGVQRRYDHAAELLTAEAMVFLAGTVDRRREQPSIIVNEVIPMKDAVEQLTGSVLLRVSRLPAEPDAAQPGQTATMRDLHATLSQFKGTCPLYLETRPATAPNLKAIVRADPQWYLQPTRGLLRRLEEMLGEANVVFKGKPATGVTSSRGGSWCCPRATRKHRHPPG